MVSKKKIKVRVKKNYQKRPKIKNCNKRKSLFKRKDTKKDFSKDDIDNMYFIIENL